MIIKVCKVCDDSDLMLFGFNTETAVAADYVRFIGDVVQLLQEGEETLEKEANASNRTLAHEWRDAAGSIPIDSQ